MQEKEERLRQAAAVFDNTSEGVIPTDDCFNVININNAFEKMLVKYLGHKSPNIHTFVNFTNDDFSDVCEEIDRASFWKREVVYHSDSNSERAGLISIHPIKDVYGSVINHVVVLTDITEIRYAQKQLMFLVNNDPLTGLSN